MNKKVLTLSTGMLLSTALAFSAINPSDLKVVSASDFKSGNNYYVVADVTGDGLTSDDILLSLQANTSGVLDGTATAALSDASFDTKGIVFKVTGVPSQTTAGHMLYTLYSNDAKAYVAVDATTNNIITDAAKTDDGVGHMWAFNTGNGAFNIAKYDGTAHYLNNNAGGHYNLQLADGEIKTIDTSTGASLIFFCEADRAVSDEDLNDFFNQKGFNLAVNYNADNGELAENIFGGDSRIWAFQVPTGGYTISKSDANGKDLYIPAGMYFFTDRVLKSGKETVSSADDIDWLASTLIMVSPRETVESTVTDRAKGQGFKLVSLKGSEFLFQENVSDYKVADNPIENACFTVTDNQVGAYPFAISLKNFFYQESSKDASKDELKEAKDGNAVSLGVIAFTAEDTQYLTTVPGAASAIFKFSDAAALDGKSLLKTTKEAAVYTIKFVAGNSEDEKLIGKYLTVAEGTSSNFKWVAKGSAITNTSYPSFQYTITDVEDEDLTDDVEKYTKITFTNRETNESITARLFAEPSYGENCYSMDITSGTVTVQPLKVVSNTYAVQNDGTAPTIDENVIIKLDPVAVNEYAGFYNVDNESVRTIRFARDKNDTSYKWYAGALWDDNTAPAEDAYELKPSDATTGYFVEDVYEAAQFQLIKAEEPETIARTFVYNNTATEDVDDVANGDKVSAYRYILRYINDGTPSEYFLSDNSGVELKKVAGEFDAEEAMKSTNTDYQKFYIKENADGSVSVFGTVDAFSTASGAAGQRVTKADKNTSIEVDLNSRKDGLVYVNGTYRSSIYESQFADTDLRMYLDGEAPNLSWEGEGHVTLQNGTAGVTGNYISVNSSNEGIVINEATDVFYLHETDQNAVVPSFYISKGKGTGSDALSERMFMFNPADSVRYPINMDYDPNYQLAKKATKVIFKAGALNESRDTMVVPALKGENIVIAAKNDNEGVWGGLNRFKFQIIEAADGDSYYNIRQIDGGVNEDGTLSHKTVYVASNNEKLYLTDDKDMAMSVYVDEAAAPTANEAISATDVKVVALDGAVNVKNAAGKNVVVSTILGQIVANEILTSDNATISVPAGIAIVSVDGEEAVKVSVK